MISSPALLLRFLRMVLDQLQLVLVRLRVVVGVFGWKRLVLEECARFQVDGFGWLQVVADDLG